MCQWLPTSSLVQVRKCRSKTVEPEQGSTVENDFVAYIDAIGNLDGQRCLLEWKTSSIRYPEEPGRRTAVSGSTACLLLMDDGYCGSCPGRVRPQEPGRGSVLAHHHH